MNKNTKKLFTFLIIALSFASCKKEEAIVATTTETSATQELVYPSIKNGRLYFPSSEAFKSYMEAIKKMSIEDVEKMNVEHGFKSHYASGKGAADVISSFGTNSYSNDSYIPDNYFGAVLNEEHQMQVDNFISEANNDYSYVVPEGGEDQIQSFEAALANGTVLPEDMPVSGQNYYNNLYVFPTNLTLEIGECLTDGKKDNKLQTRGLLSTRKIQWTYFNNTEDWRLHGEAWKGNWGLYASVGVESKCNRVANFFSLWKYYVNSKVSNLSVGFEGTLTIEAKLKVGNSTTTIPQVVNLPPRVFQNSNEAVIQHYFDQAYGSIGLRLGGLNNGTSVPTVNSSGMVTGSTGNNTINTPFGSVAVLFVKGIDITSNHLGTKNNVTRRFNMSFSIK